MTYLVYIHLNSLTNSMIHANLILLSSFKSQKNLDLEHAKILRRHTYLPKKSHNNYQKIFLEILLELKDKKNQLKALEGKISQLLGK